MNSKRVKQQKEAEYGNGPVIYWMQRDQRVNDNWALQFAIEKGKELNQPVVVAFCLVPNFLDATIRQYGFMLKGLEAVEKSLQKLNIPFFFLIGNPGEEISTACKKIKIIRNRFGF
ncbi:MAG: deoxyribodipyrimidine photo-lyase [Melioribacteraceae bacterium]|nr:deoxyribodipyrimidine photo-lyase [Melioribacteraceae bacterium]